MLIKNIEDNILKGVGEKNKFNQAYFLGKYLTWIE